MDHYARRYGEGELTLARAAEEAGVSLWRMMDHARRLKVAAQYDIEDLRSDLASVRRKGRSKRTKRTRSRG